MRFAGLLSIAILLLVPNLAAAQEWGEYVNMEEHFLTNFPGEPTIEENFEYDYEKGQLPDLVTGGITAKRFQAFDGDSRYAIIVVNYQAIDHITTLKGTVAHAASLYRVLGESTYDSYAHLERLDGHHMQLTLPNGRQMHVGIYFHYRDRRLYILEAEVAANAPPPLHFTAALQILDEDGNSIRYNIDENGNSFLPGELEVEE
jgi:hypothetical protein